MTAALEAQQKGTEMVLVDASTYPRPNPPGMQLWNSMPTLLEYGPGMSFVYITGNSLYPLRGLDQVRDVLDRDFPNAKHQPRDFSELPAGHRLKGEPFYAAQWWETVEFKVYAIRDEYIALQESPDKTIVVFRRGSDENYAMFVPAGMAGTDEEVYKDAYNSVVVSALDNRKYVGRTIHPELRVLTSRAMQTFFVPGWWYDALRDWIKLTGMNRAQIRTLPFPNAYFYQRTVPGGGCLHNGSFGALCWGHVDVYEALRRARGIQPNSPEYEAMVQEVRPVVHDQLEYRFEARRYCEPGLHAPWSAVAWDASPLKNAIPEFTDVLQRLKKSFRDGETTASKRAKIKGWLQEIAYQDGGYFQFDTNNWTNYPSYKRYPVHPLNLDKGQPRLRVDLLAMRGALTAGWEELYWDLPGGKYGPCQVNYRSVARALVLYSLARHWGMHWMKNLLLEHYGGLLDLDWSRFWYWFRRPERIARSFAHRYWLRGDCTLSTAHKVNLLRTQVMDCRRRVLRVADLFEMDVYEFPADIRNSVPGFADLCPSWKRTAAILAACNPGYVLVSENIPYLDADVDSHLSTLLILGFLQYCENNEIKFRENYEEAAGAYAEVLVEQPEDEVLDHLFPKALDTITRPTEWSEGYTRCTVHRDIATAPMVMGRGLIEAMEPIGGRVPKDWVWVRDGTCIEYRYDPEKAQAIAGGQPRGDAMARGRDYPVLARYQMPPVTGYIPCRCAHCGAVNTYRDMYNNLCGDCANLPEAMDSSERAAPYEGDWPPEWRGGSLADYEQVNAWWFEGLDGPRGDLFVGPTFEEEAEEEAGEEAGDLEAERA